jgi:hypothetical protein
MKNLALQFSAFVGIVFFNFTVLGSVSAQQTAFPDQPEAFLKQLTDFITLGKRADDEKLMKEFSTRFRGNFSPAETGRIVATCNLMGNLKLNASPYFTDYLRCVLAVSNGQTDNPRFEAWQKVVDGLFADIDNRKLDPVRVFLGFSKNFLQDNSLSPDNSSINWLPSDQNYVFKYEKLNPSLEWQKLKLTARLGNDSIEILETQGSFFPLTQLWKGVGGKVNWARNEMNDVEVTLGNYTLETNKPFYRVEKVKLRYTALFPDRELEGSFEDKVSVKNKAIELSYPRFESIDKRLKINNLGGNIQYEGGFRLYGSTVYGFGAPDQKAFLSINDARRGNRAFRAVSDNFVFRKGEKVSGEHMEMVIYFGRDSIYHPSVTMKLDIPKSEMTLERGQSGTDRNPFFDSYHKMNIDAGKIRWYIERDSIVMGEPSLGMGVNLNKGFFESLQYFSEYDYRMIQTIATRNPISILKMYAEETKRRTFSADEIARKIDPKMDASMIQTLIYALSSQGFIQYDVDKKTIEVKDKVFHFAMASQKKTDFDVLKIQSETKDANANFNMRDTTIKVSGVKGVELSEKQKVRVIPWGEQVILKNNRNFDFNGRLYSGLGIFYGKNYKFNYDNFDVQMDSARYLDLYLRTGDERSTGGRMQAQAVKSRIEHLKGVLLIDAPNNKSGREDIKMFPSFQAKDVSFVYYDAPEIQDSAYKRDAFYFKLDKFNLDGMDSITRKDINFKGLMIASDIFPDFRETLTLQPDSSLGFVNKTPVGGYPTYKSKGNYNGEVSLSSKGFLGSGILTYLDASIESKDIIFRPQEMRSSAKSFDLKENRERNVPQVVGPNVQIHWKPYQDSMYMTAKDSAFRFFPEGTYTLRSTVILTPDGVKGKGIFDWDKGTLRSELFSFGAHSVAADSMNMSIRALDASSQDLAFDTKNIKGKIDFDELRGRFKANSTDIQTYMPGVKYKTSINEFEWDLAKENILFKSDGRANAFLCVDPMQDSLKFNGNSAGYNLKTNVLNVGGVPFIQTCDAYVYPGSDSVQVQLGGVMSTIKNARIVCDTLTKYHVINRASVDIKGRKEYSALGFYEYNVAGQQQEIKFDNIVGQRVGKGSRSEKRTETRATGVVKNGEDFKIDFKTIFKGQISLFSTNKNLLFEGFAKLQLENLPDKQWFSINSYGDKNDLAIQFKYPKNEGGEILFTGIYISKENAVAYPRVMMPLTFRKDRRIIDVSGVFKYNKNTEELLLGDSTRVISNTVFGNKLVYNNKTSQVFAEGSLGLGSSLMYITMQSGGRAKTNFGKVGEVLADSNGIKGSPLNIETMTGVDFKIIPDKLLKIMAADMQSGGFDVQDVEYNKDDFYENALTSFIPTGKDYEKTVAEMKAKSLDIPSKYNPFNLFFSKIIMRWNPELQSFISYGKKVDLNSIGGVLLNKQATAYIEFKMPSNEDDRVYIYLKSPNEYYYFFGYQRGILSLSTNNQKFEEEFKKIKPKDRIKKMDDSQPYEMQWVENTTAEMFIRRVQAAQGGAKQ